ncbi:hypothetical protein STCU_10476 [Strigomonas culicis]|uniref:Uncharacterized protein n=1 Tax=Strigomonas culicis TaxID=28005 RepID=S9TMT7_9TRYP|nr:hypothetical protein STCU_10476 [Strigomonas culicis]|eukprot:EPY17668.1 hypothetical protein STCU_10476 [Strigomonas culicis]
MSSPSITPLYSKNRNLSGSYTNHPYATANTLFVNTAGNVSVGGVGAVVACGGSGSPDRARPSPKLQSRMVYTWDPYSSLREDGEESDSLTATPSAHVRAVPSLEHSLTRIGQSPRSDGRQYYLDFSPPLPTGAPHALNSIPDLALPAATPTEAPLPPEEDGAEALDALAQEPSVFLGRMLPPPPRAETLLQLLPADTVAALCRRWAAHLAALRRGTTPTYLHEPPCRRRTSKRGEQPGRPFSELPPCPPLPAGAALADWQGEVDAWWRQQHPKAAVDPAAPVPCIVAAVQAAVDGTVVRPPPRHWAKRSPHTHRAGPPASRGNTHQNSPIVSPNSNGAERQLNHSHGYRPAVATLVDTTALQQSCNSCTFNYPNTGVTRSPHHHARSSHHNDPYWAPHMLPPEGDAAPRNTSFSNSNNNSNGERKKTVVSNFYATEGQHRQSNDYSYHAYNNMPNSS